MPPDFQKEDSINATSLVWSSHYKESLVESSCALWEAIALTKVPLITALKASHSIKGLKVPLLTSQ